MKITKSKIPENSLAAKYLSDYSEAYEVITAKNDRLTPDNLLISFWTDFPAWVRWLFRLRDVLVKPFGLKGGGDDYQTFRQKLTETVRIGGSYKMMNIAQKNSNETVMQLSDKHLTAELSCYIEDMADGQVKISVMTLVHYHNLLGKIYFNVIKPFHMVIVKTIVKKSVRSLLK